MLKRTLLLLCTMALSGLAQADGIGLGAHVGLMGPGVDGFYRLNDKLVVHAAYNAFSYDYDATQEDVAYQATYDFKNAQLGLDWYPFAGAFRVSAAYVANGNELDLHAISSGTYTIDGTVYTAAEVGDLRASIQYPGSAAYAGIGWGNPVRSGKGFGVTFDIGAVYTGAADVTMNATCGAAIIATPQCDQLKADAEADRKKIEDDLANFPVWPLVQLGLSYNF